MEEDRYLSYGQAYLFTDGRIGMVSVDDVAENPITQETDTLGTRIYLWEHRRSSPSRDDFGSFGGMLEAYGVDETGDSEEDFQHLSLEAERRGERIYPVGIYEHSLVRYYLDSVTDRNQTINGVVILDKEKIGKLAVRPEEYLKKSAPKGVYKVLANYFGSRQQTLVGPATVTATVFTNWGRPEERRQTLSLRLEKPKDKVEIGAVTLE